MITYAEALKIAKGLKKNIDMCVEFENAYCFCCKAEKHDFGGAGPCFIMKDNGQALNSTTYYDDYGAEIIKEFDI